MPRCPSIASIGNENAEAHVRRLSAFHREQFLELTQHVSCRSHSFARGESCVLDEGIDWVAKMSIQSVWPQRHKKPVARTNDELGRLETSYLGPPKHPDVCGRSSKSSGT
jgi:hypothetical protein